MNSKLSQSLSMHNLAASFHSDSSGTNTENIHRNSEIQKSTEIQKT